jgi:hypothetical protein
LVLLNNIEWYWSCCMFVRRRHRTLVLLVMLLNFTVFNKKYYIEPISIHHLTTWCRESYTFRLKRDYRFFLNYYVPLSGKTLNWALFSPFLVVNIVLVSSCPYYFDKCEKEKPVDCKHCVSSTIYTKKKIKQYFYSLILNYWNQCVYCYKALFLC